MTKEVEESGVKVKKNVVVEKVEKAGDGLQVQLNNGEKLPTADILLWAVGRAPNTDTLGCEDISLDLDQAGHILVDEFQNTNIPGLYALGTWRGRYSSLRSPSRRGGDWRTDFLTTRRI